MGSREAIFFFLVVLLCENLQVIRQKKLEVEYFYTLAWLLPFTLFLVTIITIPDDDYIIARSIRYQLVSW